MISTCLQLHSLQTSGHHSKLMLGYSRETMNRGVEENYLEIPDKIKLPSRNSTKLISLKNFKALNKDPW